MENYIDSIVFGNPTQEQLLSINKTYEYDDIIDLSTFPFPKNSSINTKIELNEIVSFLNEKTKHNFKFINDNLELSIYNCFKENYDEDFSELIRKISKDFEGIIIKMKFNYNRPRPSQLAFYHELNLYPKDVIKTPNTPSYPSGSFFKSHLILKSIKTITPKYLETCLQIEDIIKNTKIYLGLNYKSDIQCSEEISDIIFASKIFQKKYLKK